LCASLKTRDLQFWEFWEMLKNALKVTLVPKKKFFLEILNFAQSFVEGKVSLADDTRADIVLENWF
jgi:hypothetical protein